jgi:tetratricopeptide (TPR) repeat protein
METFLNIIGYRTKPKEYYFDKGNELRISKKYAAAIKYFNDALYIDPKYGTALNSKGKLKIKIKKIKKKIKKIKKIKKKVYVYVV